MKWEKLLVGVCAFIIFGGILACKLPGRAAAKPTVLITSPPNGAQVKVGEEVVIQCTAFDQKGVAKVEIWVDGALLRSEANPTPQASFLLTQKWTPVTAGTHTLKALAYNVDGVASDPATVTVTASERVAITALTPTPPPSAPTPVPPTPTPVPPTPTPAPTSTPTPAGLAILYFRANVTEANPGDTITLEWASTGATKAILYHLMPTGQLGKHWDVAPTGSMEYHIDPAERNQTRFTLSVINDVGQHVEETLTVVLRCPDSWFFPEGPDECPSGPATISPGAEEHFEHGVMIWIGALDRIYVLYDDGKHPHWQVYTDEFEEGMPESDPTLEPPPGLYQPIRGFGLIWRTKPWVRDRLGWAVDQEVGFETAIQFTSRPKYNVTYIRALDGGVWKLEPEASGWSHIP